MIKLPSLDDLNHISQLMHGLDFGPLPREFKPGVVAIAQQAVLAYALDDLPTQISIGFAETVASWPIGKIATHLEGVVEQLEEIDKSLAEPLRHIGEWFEKSRLYEP